jgi:hypothetical protein
MERTMTRSLLALISAALFAVGVAGCATADAGNGFEEGTMEERTTIQVENFNPMLVTIEAISRGTDYRLGQVETSQSQTFDLPATADELDLQIMVDPLGSSDTFVSHQVTAAPGSTVHVQVQPSLDFTTVTVR